MSSWVHGKVEESENVHMAYVDRELVRNSLMFL